MKVARLAPVIILASLLGVSGCRHPRPDSANTQPAATQEEFLLPKTIFTYGDTVYALDSNKDTLEVVFPSPSVQQLDFDLPHLSEYVRSAELEWIVTRPGSVFERRIGTKDWEEFQIGSRIQDSLFSEGRLYIEQRFSGQDLVKVSRFRNGKVEESWTTAYKGIGRSAPPTFIDEFGNLSLITGGEKTVIRESKNLPFDRFHDFDDVFVIGWVQGSAFALQDSTLYSIRKQGSSEIELNNINWMAAAAGDDDAWLVGTRADRTVVAHYTDGSWSEVNIDVPPGPNSIFSAGDRACLVTRQDEGKFHVTILFAKGEQIDHATTIVDKKLFATERGVVYAGGSWWISPREPGELVRVFSGGEAAIAPPLGVASRTHRD
jgi:hypothetical protein